MFYQLCRAKSRDSVKKPLFLKRKGEPKRRVEPGSFRLLTERHTTRPSPLVSRGTPAVIMFLSSYRPRILQLELIFSVNFNTHSLCHILHTTVLSVVKDIKHPMSILTPIVCVIFFFNQRYSGDQTQKTQNVNFSTNSLFHIIFKTMV